MTDKNALLHLSQDLGEAERALTRASYSHAADSALQERIAALARLVQELGDEVDRGLLEDATRD